MDKNSAIALFLILIIMLVWYGLVLKKPAVDINQNGFDSPPSETSTRQTDQNGFDPPPSGTPSSARSPSTGGASGA